MKHRKQMTCWIVTYSSIPGEPEGNNFTPNSIRHLLKAIPDSKGSSFSNCKTLHLFFSNLLILLIFFFFFFPGAGGNAKRDVSRQSYMPQVLFPKAEQ